MQHAEASERRRILLVDADAFFVAVARQVDPEGAGKADCLIVGGSSGRGVVCSASYAARQFGVRSAMPVARALRLCPQAMVVPVPRGACSVRSKAIRAVLERFTPVVQAASIDEWYLDLAGTEALYHHEPLADTAARMRQEVFAETGLWVSVGGGTNRLVAKLAVERAKPKPGTAATGVFVVPSGDENAFLTTVSLADIPMVGPRLRDRLEARGLYTVTDVRNAGIQRLQQILGERSAQWLMDRVHGLDDSHVHSRGAARSLSHEETFAQDLDDPDDVERELVDLVHRLAWDLRREGLLARTITVKVRDFDFRTRSAARTLRTAVLSDRVILETAHQLLIRLRRARRVPVRLLGVALSGLGEGVGAPQLALFSESDPAGDTPRDRALMRAVDAVRERYGRSAVLPARLTDRPVRPSRSDEPDASARGKAGRKRQ